MKNIWLSQVNKYFRTILELQFISALLAQRNTTIAPSLTSSVNNPNPIFIFGMLQRTGTNFLENLLIKHPHCSSSVIYEGHLLNQADFLSSYITETQNKWQRMGFDKHVNFSHDGFYECIGEGIIHYLYNLQKQHASYVKGQRLMIKTPSIANLDIFPLLFPQSKILILIRNGKNVVESHFRSFSKEPKNKGWFAKEREFFMHLWADAANKLIQFEQSQSQKQSNYLIVKYEDLYMNTEQEIRRIFDFLDLDVNCYSFDYALNNTPVIGSSTFGRKLGESVSWEPVPKTPDFDPLNRAADWSDLENEQFERIAGEYQRYFMYPP